MRRTTLVAMLAPLAMLGGTPSQAADPQLVIRGTRTGWVDVTFPAAFSLRMADAQYVKQAGRYAGFFAERVGETYDGTVTWLDNAFASVHVVQGSSVAVPRFDKMTQPGADAPRYDAGTYRFHVVADGAFEIRFPVTGLSRTVVVTPKRTAGRPQVQAKKNATPTVPGGTVGAWTGRQPFVVPATRTMVLVSNYVEWGAGAHHGTSCVTATGGECEPRYAGHGSCVGSGGQRCTHTAVLPPGALPAGKWDAVHYVPTGGETRTVLGVVVVFDAPAG